MINEFQSKKIPKSMNLPFSIILQIKMTTFSDKKSIKINKNSSLNTNPENDLKDFYLEICENKLFQLKLPNVTMFLN